MSTLLLIDGSSYLYRAFHAMPDLRNPQGFPTGALYGVINMMRRARQGDAVHAACVFDAKGPTFRNDWYPEYKAHRPPMPEDLVQQIEPIHEVIRLMGWPVLELPGIEADDVIGTLAAEATRQGWRALVSTGDKDMAQLVNDQVTLVNTMTNETLDVRGVEEKFGVPPERIIDYLTLIGDKVDNVPGVEKCGPVTALKWLKAYGSLQGVMANAADIKGSVGDKLRAALDWLPQGQRLITIKTDCDLRAALPQYPDLSGLVLQAENQEALLDFYIRYGFKTWRKELEDQLAGVAKPASGQVNSGRVAQATDTPDMFGAADAPLAQAQSIHTDYQTVLTEAQLQQCMQALMQAELTALDTETTSLDPLTAQLVGISFSTQVGHAAYVPCGHVGPDAPQQLSVERVLEIMRPWLEAADKPKLGQNIKYDLHVFANHGVQVKGYVHDTLLQSYVLEAHKPHGLESLALRHLGRKGLSFEDLCGKGVHQISFSQVDVQRASQYACEDSDLTLHVHHTLWPHLQAQTDLQKVYADLEIPVSQILQRIERHGVLIDSHLLAQQSHELATRILTLEQEAHALAGHPFNLSSPKQIGEILFTEQQLPIVKKTATGAPSTDEEVLEKLAQDYPLPRMLLEHRSLAKLKSTYTDKLPLMINAQTGRVHTNYAQAVAVTGRLSSNDPNLQNIPIRTAEGRRIREAFIAPPGHQLVSADYSQIELRIMAHISGDASLLNAFAAGEDVHRATASEIFNVPIAEVSSEQRRYAKVINFGLIYGMSSFGLAGNLGIDVKSAKDYIDRYFTRYPDVKRYMDETRASAKAKGYVETVMGRRLWLPEINSPNGPRRSGAERAAINAPMQGTAADLIKLSMIAVQAELDAGHHRTRMIMQVHDELVLEVPDEELDWVKTEIPRLMASVAQLKVPLLAEVGVGRNWDEAH